MTVEHDSNQLDETAHSRRQALKKGGTAAAVVAGAWTVPVITGMGVAPAGAAVCSNTKTVDVSGSQNFNATFDEFESSGGGCSDPAAWTGATMAKVVPVAVAGGTATVNISAKQPAGNVDNPCFQTVASIAGQPSATWAPPTTSTVCSQTVTSTVSCIVTLMDVTSCPPLGIANDNACWRVGAGGCSAALNGTAKGKLTVSCNVTVTGSYEEDA